MVSHIGQVDKLGCFVFADGDRYDGHFRRGAMHGYGVYYWANDRATYFGKWDDNAQSDHAEGASTAKRPNRNSPAPRSTRDRRGRSFRSRNRERRERDARREARALLLSRFVLC